MTREASAPGAAGGRARRDALSPDERQSIARKAALARWGELDGQTVPKATHSGSIRIGDIMLPCYVLEDGTRVLSERGMARALGGNRGGVNVRSRQRSPGANGYKPMFLSAGNLDPYISPSLSIALSRPIVFRANGATGHGIEARLIPEICDVWLKARAADGLLPSQDGVAQKAEILMRGLAHVGIIALVDEATGFQRDRDQTELQRILSAYISEELLPWTRQFPETFYQELFRLRGWPYSPPQPKRPRMIGKLTNQLVYDKLPDGVLDELQSRNPVVKNGRRRHKHHQLLTEDIGHPQLKNHLIAVTTLMRAAPTWAVFTRMFNRAFPPKSGQMEMDLDFGDETEV